VRGEGHRVDAPNMSTPVMKDLILHAAIDPAFSINWMFNGEPRAG
jgi:hypothetical protein